MKVPTLVNLLFISSILMIFSCVEQAPEPKVNSSQKIRNINGFTYLGTYQSSDYYASNNLFTWPSARILVSKIKGAHMVSIDSAGENIAILNFLSLPPFPFASAWIGLTDEGEEGIFRWTNLNQVNYTNWAPGEPNNQAFPGCTAGTAQCDEHYVHIHSPNHPYPGTWNDAPNWVTYKVIIETKSSKASPLLPIHN